ncbi:MAG: hypothetical protein WC242_03610 [Candidatus Paceibacterota bacterium]|jgi:hypothetical protein
MTAWACALVGLVSALLYGCIWRATFVWVYKYWMTCGRFNAEDYAFCAFFASFIWLIYWPLHLAGKLGNKARLRSHRY